MTRIRGLSRTTLLRCVETRRTSSTSARTESWRFTWSRCARRRGKRLGHRSGAGYYGEEEKRRDGSLPSHTRRVDWTGELQGIHGHAGARAPARRPRPTLLHGAADGPGRPKTDQRPAGALGGKQGAEAPGKSHDGTMPWDGPGGTIRRGRNCSATDRIGRRDGQAGGAAHRGSRAGRSGRTCHKREHWHGDLSRRWTNSA